MKTLAIIIPAYKPDFLQRTLASLAEQSDHRFTVYIGNDASPYPLEDIVDAFRGLLDLQYHYFPDNFGGNNLVGHWERCLRLCQGEEWVCLFSDDDMMQSGCIDAFHHAIVPDDVNVVHFNLTLIDEKDSVIQECPDFPDRMDAALYFDSLFRRKIVARMPEFIFKRSFLERNGIVPFDLAWRSDTATIMKAALSGGILTIKGNNSRVLWRASTKNISGIDILKKRKNRANISFFNWVYDNRFVIIMSRFYLLKTIIFSLEYSSAWEFFRDGCRASFQMKFARWRRALCLLFVVYRIPYHWMETRRY